MKRKIKWIVGDEYYLKYRPSPTLKPIIKRFICKKFIYSIGDVITNIVIMKNAEGTPSDRYTLSKDECLKYHIKYIPGLEVYSMDMNWFKSNTTQNE